MLPPLPGAATTFNPDAAWSPSCSLELVGGYLSCAQLTTGDYVARLSRGGATLDTVALTVPAQSIYGGVPSSVAASFTAAVQHGDVVEVRAAGGGRVLSRLTAASVLQVASDGLSSAIVCEPNALVAGVACPATGRLTTGNLLAQAADEFGPGSTVVAVSYPSAMSPTSGAILYAGSFHAYSEAQSSYYATGGGVAMRLVGDPVQLSVRPHGSSGAWTAFGNANTTAGAVVSGLVPGRWDARWTLTDRLGDQATAVTSFTIEPGQTGPAGSTGLSGANGRDGGAGAAGGQGQQGVQGVGGPAGSKGKDGRDARVNCVVGKQKRGKVKVTCRVSDPASNARARLMSGTRTLARGRTRHGRLVFRVATKRLTARSRLRVALARADGTTRRVSVATRRR